MMKSIGTTTVLACALLLGGCGGGGGAGDPAPEVSTESYPIRTAWVNTVNESGTRSFTLSGSSGGTPLTGSGSATFGGLASAVFEGRPALSKTTVLTGSIVVGGQTVPYGGTSVSYLDTNYQPLGSASGEYWVVTGTPSIPVSARVNDAGVIATYQRYATATKTSPRGTATASYALQPESVGTALLRVVVTERSTSGTVTATTIQTFRLTPAGAVTRLSEEMQEGSSVLTLRY